MLRIRTTAALSAALLLTSLGCGDSEDPAETAENSVANNSANGSSNNGMPGNNASTANNSNNSNNSSNVDAGGGDAENPNDGGGTCDPVAVALETIGAVESVADATLTSEALGENGFTVTLDAALGGPAMAAESAWVYVDVDAPAIVEIDDVEAMTDNSWEFAFKRAEIRLNSADSGPRSLMLTRVEETTWDTVPAPDRNAEWLTDDFVTDTCDVETYGRGSIATAFSDWYDYNPETHVVSAPEGVVYFTYDATTHAVSKFQIASYESGIYTFDWAPVMSR